MREEEMKKHIGLAKWLVPPGCSALKSFLLQFAEEEM